MEYVEGQTLQNLLGQIEGNIPAPQVLEMMLPIVNSLIEIHKSGIIHRDISPDNIMLTNEGNLKLLDFGAAREFNIEDRSLSILLKRGYAPPEQYSRKGVQGPHTDVYALSATIYKIITGVTPEDSLDRLTNDDLETPNQLGVSLPAYQEAALMKGLALSYEHRFKTVEELHYALITDSSLVKIDRIPKNTTVRSFDLALNTPNQHEAYPEALKNEVRQKKIPNVWKYSFIGGIICISIFLAALTTNVNSVEQESQAEKSEQSEMPGSVLQQDSTVISTPSATESLHKDEQIEKGGEVVVPESPATPELYFEGMPFSQIVGYSFEEIDEILGGYSDRVGVYENLGLSISISGSEQTISYYWLNSKRVEINGVSASLNREGLRNILGAPAKEVKGRFYGSNAFYMTYYMAYYDVSFIFYIDDQCPPGDDNVCPTLLVYPKNAIELWIEENI